jgi:anti-sigma factor (TIGR02949 family)
MADSCYDCREAFSRLDDFLDRELTADEMARVRVHLETCEECAHHFAFEEGMLRCLRSKLGRIDVPADLLARVREALGR